MNLHMFLLILVLLSVFLSNLAFIREILKLFIKIMIRSPPVTRKFNGSATNNGTAMPTTVNNVTTPVNGNHGSNVLSPPMGMRSRSRSPSQRKNGQEMGNGIDKVRILFC